MSSLGEAVVDVGANTAPFEGQVKDGVESSLAGASKSMQNVGKKMTGIGNQMALKVTAPLLGIAAAGIKTAGDFESSMNVLQAATGMPNKAMAAMEKQAIELGASTVFSANEAADAMLELGKAGFNSAQIQKAVPEVMNLAATEGLALADSAGIVSSALSQFSLKAGESGQVVNALAGASNASRASVATLSESLKLVGSAASGVGLSVQETAGTLAALADNGLDGSVAGTSLAAMFNKLIPQTEKASGAMEDLGLDFVKGNGQFEDITNIAQQLQDKLGGISPAARKAKLSAIFGNDASTLAAVNAVMKAGESGIKKYTAAAMDQDAASKLAEARMKGVKGAVEKMKGSLETAALVLGQALIPFMTQAADVIGTLADKFTNLSPQAQKFVIIGGAILAAIGPVLIVLGTLISSVGAIAGVFAGVTAAVAAPIAIFALLAVGLGLLLYKSEAAREVLVNAFNQIKTAIMSAIGPTVEMIQGQLLPAFMAMWPIIEKVGVVILKVFAGAIVGAVKGAIKVITGIIQVITGVVQVVSGILTGDWSRVWEGVKNIVKGITKAIIGIIQVWLNVGILGIFRKGFTLLVGVAKGGWNMLKGLFKSSVNGLKSVVQGAWNAIKGATSAVWNGIKAVISTVWGAIKAVVSGQIALVRAVFTNGFNALKGIATGAWNAVKGAVVNGVSNVVSTVKSLPGKITSALSGFKDLLVNAGRELMEGLLRGITEKIGAIKDKMSEVAGAIKGFLPGSPVEEGPLTSWNNGGAGKRLMELLARGIGSGIPAVAAATKSAVDAIVAGFVDAEVGPAVTKITEMFSDINDAIESAAQERADQALASSERAFSTERKALEKSAKQQEKALEKKYDGKKLRKKLAALEEATDASLRKIDRREKKAAKGIEATRKGSTASLRALAGANRAAIDAMASAWDALDVQLNGENGIAAKLEEAKNTLKEKTDELLSYAASVGDRIIESVFGSGTEETPVSFDNIVKSLQEQEAEAAAFATVLKELADLGLNEVSYDQIASGGTEALAAAQALVAAGQAGIDQVNALQGSIDQYAADAGTTAANYLYAAGVAAAQGTVDGLAAEQASLVEQMMTLGTALGTAIAEAIKNVSLPATGAGDGSGGGGGGGGNGKHKWEPVSKSNRKCSICGKNRGASVHTNQGGNASGSLSTPGGWTMTGERGRELVRLPEGSRVYPAHQTERMTNPGGSDGRPIEMTVQLPTGDPEAAAMAVMNRLAGRL